MTTGRFEAGHNGAAGGSVGGCSVAVVMLCGVGVAVVISVLGAAAVAADAAAAAAAVVAVVIRLLLLLQRQPIVRDEIS